MTVTRYPGNGYIERPTASSLADVVDTILDKGIVIDIYLRISLVGIELITLDARIVIASVDTYLQFAEAVNRIDLTEQSRPGLPELMESVPSGGKMKAVKAAKGAKDKSSNAFKAAKDKVSDMFEGDEEGENGKKGSKERSSQRRKS